MISPAYGEQGTASAYHMSQHTDANIVFAKVVVHISAQTDVAMKFQSSFEVKDSSLRFCHFIIRRWMLQK